MASGPPHKVELGHQLYRDARYREALLFYTQALSAAKTKTHKIALHSNRAACYLKLQDFKKAAEECTSVLQLDHNHTGALMLRAQTLVTLKEYHSALFDVNRLMELNPSSDVYQNLEARLRTQLALAPIPESEAELEEEEEEEVVVEEERVGQEEELYSQPRKTKEEGKIDQKNDTNMVHNIQSKTPCKDNKVVLKSNIVTAVVSSKAPRMKELFDPAGERGPETIAALMIDNGVEDTNSRGLSEAHSKGWQAIPKPKGHSTLDYTRWDRVEDDSSEDDDDSSSEEESQPQYHFRVRTVGIHPVK